MSSSTRRTSTAASSARTSRTSCGGCGGSRAIYGAEPQFLLASATISNPGELGDGAARRARHGDRRTTPRRAPSARSCSGTRRCSTPSSGCARSALGRGRAAAGDVRRPGAAHPDVREEPQGGRADPPLHGRAARRRRAALALPRGLHRAAAARDRAAAGGRASCSASRRRTRSSSGSTSASSTP